MREKPVPVVVQIVDRRRVETTVANTRSDTVKACRRVRLAPTMVGQITKLAVREGDHVESGQLLFSEQELKRTRSRRPDLYRLSLEPYRKKPNIRSFRKGATQAMIVHLKLRVAPYSSTLWSQVHILL